MPHRLLPRLGPAALLALMALSVGLTTTVSVTRRAQGLWVSHTLRVLAMIEGARAAQAEVRYQERNASLGGDADRRGHFDAIAAAEASADDLRRMVSDNPAQLRLLARRTAEWGLYVRESRAVMRSQGPLGERIALTTSATHLGRFKRASAALEEMRREEGRLLAIREASLKRTIALFNGAVAGMTLVMGFSLVLFARLSRRERRSRREADDASAAERAALESARLRMESIAEAAFEGIAITQDGVLVDANSAYVAMFGYGSVDDVRGMRVDLFAAPESRDLVVGKRAALDEEPYEAIVLRRDGSKFAAEVRGRSTEFAGRAARVTALRDLTYRKEAERAVRESEARLAEAQRVARVGSWSWDVPSGRISWSKELFRIFGIDPSEGELPLEEIIARHHPEDRAALAASIECATLEGEPYEVDLRIAQPDGSYRWARAVGKAERGASGAVVRLFGTLADVHRQKTLDEELRDRAERLRQSEAALRALLKAAPIVLFTADARGTVTLSKGAGLAALGMTPNQAVGGSAFDMAPDLESAAALRLALEGETVSFEAWHGEVCLQTEVRPLTGADGEISGIIGVAMDITDGKRVETLLRESQRSLLLATESVRLGVWDWDVAANRMEWDARMFELYGIREDDFDSAYSAWQKGLHPEDRAMAEAAVKAALDGIEGFDTEFRVVWPSGEVRHIEAHGLVLRAGDGSPTRMIGVNWDVTSRREAQIERQRSEERFRTLFERSSDAHLIFDETGIVDCNPAAVALLRCEGTSELLSIHPAVLSPEFQPDGRRSDEKCVEMDRLARQNGSHRFEWTHRKLDGEEFPVEVTLTGVTLEGRPALLTVWHDLTGIKAAERKVAKHAAMVEDQRDELAAAYVTQEEQRALLDERLAEVANMNVELEAQRYALDAANERLAELATVDGLTGLKNQRTFRERLAEECEEARRLDRELSLLVLDVDKFKAYNDSFGHPAGDAALRSVGTVLGSQAREYDVAARNGGEEFALLLPGTDAAGAAVVAERVRRAVEGEEWPLRPVTVSVGVATLRPSFLTAEEFVAAADRALYDAKEGGRNRVVVAAVVKETFDVIAEAATMEMVVLP